MTRSRESGNYLHYRVEIGAAGGCQVGASGHAVEPGGDGEGGRHINPSRAVQTGGAHGVGSLRKHHEPIGELDSALERKLRDYRLPLPALASALTVNLRIVRMKIMDYRSNRNPPIHHGKELFLRPDHRLFAKFAELTRIKETNGLYEASSQIGTRDGWNDTRPPRAFTLKATVFFQ